MLPVAPGEDARHRGHLGRRVGHDVAAVVLDAAAFEARQVGALAGGEDDVVGVEFQEAGAVELRVELAVLVLDLLAELEDGHPLLVEPQGSPAGAQLHALGDRELDLSRAGRHVAALLQRGQVDVRRTLAQGGQRDVDGDVAATDDDDPRPDAHGSSAARGAQEVDAAEHEGEVGSFDGKQASLLRSEPEEDRIVPLAKLPDARDRGAGEDPHAQGPDLVDLLLEEVGRVAVGGDAVAQHSAGVLLRLVDLDVVPEGAEVVGRGEARWPGADDADPLPRRRSDLGPRVAAIGEAVLGRLGLQRPDEDGTVMAAANTGGLARRGADEAAGQGQRVVAPDDLDGGAMVAPTEVRDEGRDVDVGRAGTMAGCRLPLQAEPLRTGLAPDVAFPLLAVVAQGAGERPGGRQPLRGELERDLFERDEVAGLPASEGDLGHQARGPRQQPAYRRVLALGEQPVAVHRAPGLLDDADARSHHHQGRRRRDDSSGREGHGLAREVRLGERQVAAQAVVEDQHRVLALHLDAATPFVDLPPQVS